MAVKQNGNGSHGKTRRGRRSKAESMTGEEENAVAVRKAGELDLQVIEIDDGDFDLHLRSIKGAKESLDKYKRLYDGCCKQAKKVSAALLDSVKLAIKFEGLDTADIKRALEISGYVLRRTNSPVQLTIHDTLFGDVHDAAYSRGKNDQMAGRTCNSPYPTGSDLDEQYKRGWNLTLGEQLGLSADETVAAIEGDGIGHNSNGAPEAGEAVI